MSLRTSFIIILAAFITVACATTSPTTLATKSGIDKSGFDLTANPADNFFDYVNGTWLKTTEIPADKSNYGMFSKLADEAKENIKTIIEETGAKQNVKAGSAEQKIRDYYNTYYSSVDSPEVNLAGLNDEVALINNISNHSDLYAAFAELGKVGIRSPIGGFIYSDLKNPDVYEVYLNQSGLSLPDRDYYLESDEQFTRGLGLYRTYLETLAGYVGLDNASSIATDIIALETNIARIMWPKERNRNPSETYNLYTFDELSALAPSIDWNAYYQAAGVPLREKYIVRQPDFFSGLSNVVTETPLQTWKHYLHLKSISQFADVLGKPVYDASFDFYSRGLSGIEEQQPLWKRAVGSTENVMGELLGQLYVEKHFKPEAKERMETLVDNLIKAYEVSIKELDWMSPTTKENALEKLANFRTKIGYPDEWRDYSDLEVIAGDLVGNDKRAAKFEYDFIVGQLGSPVNKELWGITPQTVNAYYQPAWNEIVFPAAILQPPFFNLDAEDAVNYGGIGAVIGHEIGHGFDDSGRKYDGGGKLSDWWTAEDAEKFEVRKNKLAAQFDSYVVIDDLNINGQFTSGENIGDLGGLSIAYKAYKMSLPNNDGPEIDGMTADQRVFYGWAQVWRRLYRDAELKKRITTDPHSPARFRVNGIVVNIPAFYDAFDVKPGDAMYLSEDDRVKIW